METSTKVAKPVKTAVSNLTLGNADDEQEGLMLLGKVASAWARHEHRMVSLVLHTRLHPLATAPTTPA